MASFYNTYQTSAGETAPKNWWDDEQAPQVVGPTIANPQTQLGTSTTMGTAQTGAASPASQIQTTGNTGMNQTPPGGTSTPSPQSTTGTPSSATGSGLPPYGANWAFGWMGSGGSTPLPGPGANTTYQAPLSLAQMGVDFSKVPNYNPGFATVGGFQAPQGDSSAATTALQSILGGDGSGMDTSAMKNRLKEQRLIMEGDEMGASRQSAAARGLLDSGIQGAEERRIRGDARKDILGGFRDIDIEAARDGVKNKLTASQILDQVLTGDMNRADTAWQNDLKRTEFMDDQARYGSDFGLKKEQAALDAATKLEDTKQKAAGINLDSWKAGTDASLETREQDIKVAQAKTNELIARMGLAVNLEEIAKGSSRDKMQFLTDIFKVLVDQEQFNAQMGFNYNQMGMNMNEMIANVAKSIGVG